MILLSTAPVAAVDEDRPISNIEVVAEGLQDPSEVLAVLGLDVGSPLDRGRLRQGVHTLYAGGEVEHVRIESVEAADGLVVRVRLSLRARVEQVVISGVEGRWQRHVRRWLEVQAGGPASVSRVEAGARRVLSRLRERGYPVATVEPYLEYLRSANTVIVKLEVALGRPRMLGPVVIEGVADGAAMARRVRGGKAGEHLTDRLQERIREQVESELRAAGHWEAEVVGSDVLTTEHGETLVIRAEPGPRYELELTSPPGTEGLARSAVPDPVKEDIHPAQSLALAERIREALQERGHLLATTSVELDLAEGYRILRVAVDPDRERRITAVELRGAAQLAEHVVRAAMRVRPGPTHGWRGRKVTDDSLETDRVALEETYRRAGFADVRVAPPLLEPDGEDGVRVVFEIAEGERWTLTDLRMEGFPVEAIAAYEAAGETLQVAMPWSPHALESTRRRLEAELANVGYPDGRVESEVDTSEAGRASVSLRADPGPFVRIGEVVVAGLERTRRHVVHRVLEDTGVRTGEPWSLDSLLWAQREMYELGIFSSVELVAIPGQEHGHTRGLVVRCEEGDQHSYLFGIGWDTVDHTRVTLGWSHLNLFGGAHALSVETRLSNREKRYQATLREARVPLLKVPGYLVMFQTEEEFATYSQERRGVSFEVGDRRHRPLRKWLRYEYQIVQPDAPPEVLSDLERQDQEIRVASITPSVEWDTRDDLLMPRRGLLAALSAEYAFPIFAAEAEFVKLKGSMSSYGPVLDGTGAFGLRLGAIYPIGAGNDGPANLQVPLATRFFAGGRVSHRAFKTDRLGIVGDTLDANRDPIGGNAVVIVNLEYQLPLKGVLSGVVFLDGGNVWSAPSRVSVDDFRWGVGLGFRIDTPAGPLRLEYGHKLDREDGEPSGQLFLSFGVPF